MRKLLAVLVLCMAVCFGISGLQLMRGKAEGSIQLAALMVVGIALAGIVVAGVLAFGRPSDDGDDHDDNIFSLLPEGPRNIVTTLLMVGIGLLIAGVTLKGVLAGAVRPMISSGVVHLRDRPVVFVLESVAWLIAAWLIGWVAPRTMARKGRTDES